MMYKAQLLLKTFSLDRSRRWKRMMYKAQWLLKTFSLDRSRKLKRMRDKAHFFQILNKKSSKFAHSTFYY